MTVEVHKDLRDMYNKYGFHDCVQRMTKEELFELLKFRYSFIKEELNEGFAAIKDRNPEEVCDSLIDMIVVAVGTLDLFGVDFEIAWREVRRANMSKERGIKKGRESSNGMDLIKPKGWQGPNHEGNHGLLKLALDIK